jgi:predicted KAP-like P-loop ATPase
MIINIGAPDAPISKKKDDELHRASFAERFARLVTSFSGDDRSNIFALYGEWGSGKTSTWSLIKAEIERMDPGPQIVEFSPWAYSSYDQVLNGFFDELLAALKHEPVMKQVAKKMGSLSHALLGLGSAGFMVAGTDASGATATGAAALTGAGVLTKKIAKEAKAAANQTLAELHENVARVLMKVKRPILILIDDVDRLPPVQVVALFQLIRVNASLPMVNYLLLMDRDMVERSLKEQKLAKTFLEKIVQFGIDLPLAAPEDLHAMAVKRVMQVLTEDERARLQNRFEQATTTAAGILDTPRAIGRVTESFGFLLEFFRNGQVLEVDPVDLFLLETLRCQAPKAYTFIRDETGSYSAWDNVLPYLPKDNKAENRRKEKTGGGSLAKSQRCGQDHQGHF